MARAQKSVTAAADLDRMDERLLLRHRGLRKMMYLAACPPHYPVSSPRTALAIKPPVREEAPVRAPHATGQFVFALDGPCRRSDGAETAFSPRNYGLEQSYLKSDAK